MNKGSRRDMFLVITHLDGLSWFISDAVELPLEAVCMCRVEGAGSGARGEEGAVVVSVCVSVMWFCSRTSLPEWKEGVDRLERNLGLEKLYRETESKYM